MSAPKGRHSQAPGSHDLQAEREATREVTRKLHEAIQEAKLMSRELGEAMAVAEGWATGFRDELEKTIRKVVADRAEQYTADMMAGWNAWGTSINEQTQTLRGELTRTGEMIIEAQHEVIGLPDRQATMAMVQRHVAEVVLIKMDEEGFRQDIADRVSQALQAIWDGMRTGRAARSRGQVIVKTPGPGERLGVYIEGQYVEGSG